MSNNKYILSIVVAKAKNRVIGRDNNLPWHLPNDLNFFKKKTLNKTVIMGRKTYQSIGRPLPRRVNIIVTTDKGFDAPGCTVVHSLEDALKKVNSGEECMIIGGDSLYKQALPLADRIWLTEVAAEPAGDAFFPVLDDNDWQELSRESHPADERHAYGYSFVQLERKTGT